jgi:hypothetical protein
MKYKIWIEGWSATGGSSDASFIGEVEAESFREACLTVRYHDKFHYVPARGQLLSKQKTFNAEGLTDWGCRLFDNEEDARKSFG